MAAELVTALPGSVAFVDATQVPKGLKVTGERQPGGNSKDEIDQFNGHRESVAKDIRRIGDLTGADDRSSVESLERGFHDLRSSWRIFYRNFGRDQTRAITEVVMRAEPLSRVVIQDLLPHLQEAEKNREAAASAQTYRVAKVIGRISIAVFVLSGLESKRCSPGPSPSS